MNVEDKLTEMNVDLDELRERAAADRPRIDRLDRAVFGEVVDGWSRPGLLHIVHDQQPIVDQVGRLINVGKWAARTFTAATVVGLINLAVDALPL